MTEYIHNLTMGQLVAYFIITLLAGGLVGWIARTVLQNYLFSMQKVNADMESRMIQSSWKAKDEAAQESTPDPTQTFEHYHKKKEALAEEMHDIWRDWMKSLLRHINKDERGNHVIHDINVSRWKKQAERRYKDLSESEKDSDREQADKIIKVLELL